jgi:lysine/ornithine N-monooxygenase
MKKNNKIVKKQNTYVCLNRTQLRKYCDEWLDIFMYSNNQKEFVNTIRLKYKKIYIDDIEKVYTILYNRYSNKLKISSQYDLIKNMYGVKIAFKHIKTFGARTQ